MKLLIAPIHYIIDSQEGSEYSRAYDYLMRISEEKDISGYALTGFSNIDKINNFKIISFFKTKPLYISNITRIKFILWIYFKGFEILRKNKIDLIWHNGPFAIGETFSLISLLRNKKLPFIIGPINSPHTYIGNDESRSMGNKLGKNDSFVLKTLKIIDNFTYFTSKVFQALSLATLKKSSLVICRDLTGKRIIESQKINNTIVFRMGTNLDKFYYKRPLLNLRNNKINFINVSYLVDRKRTEDLIYAFDILVNNKSYNEFKLTIIGDGPQKRNLIELVKKLKLEKNISFLGYIPKAKLKKYYKNADIFLSASLSESIPAMYLEAMAASLPLIIVKNNTYKDLLELKAGIIGVSSKNPEEFAKAISSLAKDRLKQQQFGNVNYKLAYNEFHLSKSIKKLVKLMKDISENI